MKLTILNTDYITITEKNMYELQEKTNEKIHLIKFNFETPTREKILSVINTFTKTNRYVISNNVKLYNDVLRTTGKKYYIENESGTNLISYLRKNNKILLNINNLRPTEQLFIMEERILKDILYNVEVLQMKKSLYVEKIKFLFDDWNGNLVLTED
jgi:hypothetical protein